MLILLKIALTTTYGLSGDIGNVYLENGTVIPIVIADAKDPSDPNWSVLGHKYDNQLNVLEFEVVNSVYKQTEYARQYDPNPKSNNRYHLPWDHNSNVVSIEINGSVIER